MVLESLMLPSNAEKRPYCAFFLGFLYLSVAVFLSLWIFEKQASLIMVFLTVMASIPLIYSLFKNEESKDLEIESEKRLLLEHHKVMFFLLFLFFGVTFACVLWYTVLPSASVASIFNVQTQAISDINNNVSGNYTQTFSSFTKILLNNLKVLSFSILFSLVYGIGAIFILTWNATVIGAAMGNVIRSNISAAAAQFGFAGIGAYFQAVSLGILRYSIHGIPEIASYFYGGLAGGILSAAIIKHHYKSDHFMHILYDASDLFLISLSFLFLAALLEVYITPLFF